MTRAVIALALITLAACSGDSGDSGCDYKGRHFDLGAQFMDACNACTCMSAGVECTTAFCNGAIDANPTSCVPTDGCDQSGFGPLCGGTCCNAGEKCVNNVCMCGDHADCGNAASCGGPVMQGNCGTVCCDLGTPCPQ